MKIKHWTFIIILYLLIFQDFLQSKIGILSSIDELVSYGLLFFTTIYFLANRKKLNKHITIILFLSSIILFIGILGNLFYDYQKLSNAIKDIIIVFKSILAYISTLILLRNFDILKYGNLISLHLNIISAIIFILSIINIFLPIFPYYDYRWGINTQQLFFSHPTFLASTCSLIICILAGLSERNKYNYISIGALTIVILLSGRIKAIAFIIIYLILMYLTINNKKIKLSNIVFMLIAVIAISYKRVLNQLILNVEYPRAILNRYGFIIANEHFPLGSGFGTFASHISGKFYSELYYKYGIYKVYGLTKDYHPTISDSFWPMIIGQFGYIGLVCMILIILAIFIQIYINRKTNKYYYIAGLGLILYLLVSSTSESSFVNYYSVPYFIMIGIFTLGLIKKKSDI